MGATRLAVFLVLATACGRIGYRLAQDVGVDRSHDATPDSFTDTEPFDAPDARGDAPDSADSLADSADSLADSATDSFADPVADSAMDAPADSVTDAESDSVADADAPPDPCGGTCAFPSTVCVNGVCAPPIPATSFALGAWHTCAVRSEQLYCWGSNSFGQLGNGPGGDVLSPAVVTAFSGETVVSVFASVSNNTCATTSSSTYCWGFNSNSLGTGDNVDRSTPALIGSNVPIIIRGSAHMFVQLDAQFFACGENGFGETGLGDTAPHPTPVAVPGGEIGAIVVAAWGATASILRTGEMSTVGANGLGQRGDGTADALPHPAEHIIGTDTDWIALTAGDFHFCALKRDGRLFCWGNNDAGELADLAPFGANVLVPTEIPPVAGGRWRQVATGTRLTVGIAGDGSLWAWGLGSSTKTQVGSDTDWTVIAVGGRHACGLRGGVLYCFGDNTNGQLGTGDRTATMVPIAPPLP